MAAAFPRMYSQVEELDALMAALKSMDEGNGHRAQLKYREFEVRRGGFIPRKTQRHCMAIGMNPPYKRPKPKLTPSKIMIRPANYSSPAISEKR